MRWPLRAPGTPAPPPVSPLAGLEAVGRAALSGRGSPIVRLDATDSVEGGSTEGAGQLATPIPRVRRTGFALAANELGLDTAGRVPEVLRAFKMGANPTTKGTFTLTGDGCKRSIDWFAEYGNALVIDYEHCTFELVKNLAAGWVEQGSQWAERDGLYVRSDWQPTARDEIARKDYRYFSPTFEYDLESGEILCLLPIALTNFPATLRMTPLAEQGLRALAARAGIPLGVPQRVPLRGPARAPASAAPPPAAAHSNDAQGAAAPPPPAGPAGAPPVVPAGAPGPTDESPVTMKELLAMLCALMGIPIPTEESEAKTKIVETTSALSVLRRDLLALSGQTTLDGALGTIKAWKASHETLASDRATIEAAKKEALKAAGMAKISTAVAELRLPPAQRPYAESIADNATQLDAFLATLTPMGAGPGGAAGAAAASGVVQASGAKPPTVVSGAAGPGTSKLSEGERKVLRTQGLTEEQITKIDAEGAAA